MQSPTSPNPDLKDLKDQLNEVPIPQELHAVVLKGGWSLFRMQDEYFWACRHAKHDALALIYQNEELHWSLVTPLPLKHVETLVEYCDMCLDMFEKKGMN